MPEIAQRVVLDLKRRKLFVDGQEFPWLITAEGVRVEAGVDEICQATVTFFADAIEVIPREALESAEKPQVATSQGGAVNVTDVRTGLPDPDASGGSGGRPDAALRHSARQL